MVAFNDASTGICGVHLARHPDHTCMPMHNHIHPSIRHVPRPSCTHTFHSDIPQPDQSDQIHLLRYLKSCLHLGPTFSTDPAAFQSGVTVIAAADSFHACHPDGHLQLVYTIQIGTINAPFVVHSSAETAGILLSASEAEHIAPYSKTTNPSLILQSQIRSRSNHCTLPSNPTTYDGSTRYVKRDTSNHPPTHWYS